jgi:uncharacterized membrane protein/mono/diheme cytochrome c family protein
VLLTISEFIGRLHPALVHLPVGILVLAFILQCISFRVKNNAMQMVLLIGAASAWLACLTGYVLSTHDDYDPSLVNWHQWMGIGTAVVCTIGYLVYKKFPWLTMIAVFVLVSITGHMGGTLTHGEGYLSLGGEAAATGQPPIANVQEAMAYDAVIQPVLQRKCYSCHNANKRKGGLRMDEPDWLMKGGKNGPIIVVNKADESEMIKRILLPKENEDHMPPKEKPQLTEKETALLHWWISSGASFDKKVKDLQQPASIQPILVSLQQPVVLEEKATADIPAEEVGEADQEAIQKLKDRGVVVLPVAQNSNYVMVNFVSARNITNKDLELLLPLKKQLVWLKLGGAPVNDSAITAISKLGNLTRLHLDHTSITDVSKLKALQQLRYLNLVGTRVTLPGVLALKDIKQLRSLYVYQTAVSDTVALRKACPKTQIDIGGYVVPILE